MDLPNPSNGDALFHPSNPFLDDYYDSATTTPFTSAPSSPGRSSAAAVASSYHHGYFVSCPASPMHYVLSSAPATAPATGLYFDESPAIAGGGFPGGGFEFYGAESGGRMIPADEIFLNGQIRPLKLSAAAHGHRPLSMAPLPDLDEDAGDGEEESGEGRGRSRSRGRRTRSMSPVRSPRFRWSEEDGPSNADIAKIVGKEQEEEAPEEGSTGPVTAAAASSSSSTAARNSRRWIFLKDLLYRSKSEGSGRAGNGSKERFWHSISFSPSSMKLKSPAPEEEKVKTKSKGVQAPVGGRRQRKPPAGPGSAHERHYAASRATAEEMRRRTFLPYRQGLLGCLGFSSRSYGAMQGFAKALNPVSSR